MIIFAPSKKEQKINIKQYGRKYLNRKHREKELELH